MKPRLPEELFPFLHDPWLGPCYQAVLKALRRWYEWNPSDIDDMVNQVGLQLHELQQQDKIQTTSQQVLRGIASNVVNSEIRNRTRSRAHWQRYLEEPRPNSLMVEKPVPEVWERLYGIVRKRLTGSLREFFEYFIQIQEFSPANAAKEFGIEPDAANQRASRIRMTWRQVRQEVDQSLMSRYEETRSLDAEEEWLTLYRKNSQKLHIKCHIACDLLRLYYLAPSPSIIPVFSWPSEPLNTARRDSYWPRIKSHTLSLLDAQFNEPLTCCLQAWFFGLLCLIHGNADLSASRYVSAIREYCLFAPPEDAVALYREYSVVSAAFLDASQRDRGLRVLKQQPWPESLRILLNP